MRTLVAALLLCSACSGCAHRPRNFDVSADQRHALVSETLQRLDEHYVFPERLPQVVPELKARWSSPEFEKLGTAHALVDRMNDDFGRVVQDRHLFLRLAVAIPPQLFGDPLAQPTAAEVASAEAEDRKDNFGIAESRVLDGNVGYLKLRGFPSPSAAQQAAYAKALQPLLGTRALVLDLRDNGGGDGESVADLVGYFLPGRTLLQYDVTRAGKALEHVSTPKATQYRGALYVLTNGHTFSAAEECAYDLQTQKRATVVGEHTGGGANHNRFFRVAKDFALSVPFMTTKNAVTGTNWEGRGVQPDVQVDAAAALQKALALATARP